VEFRIGDRDSATGLYDVIWPDGGVTRNGIKIFNSEHRFGDVVLATERSDGMMILDGVKAVEVFTSSLDLSPILKADSYLNGQIFNSENEVMLPIVSVRFAPASPTSLVVGAGSFTIRVSANRQQRKDLRVQCAFAGTAVSANYTVTGLAVDSPTVPVVIIPAGADFADITITPIGNVATNKTIIFKAVPAVNYKVGMDSSVTATILGSVVPTVTVIQLCPTQLEWGNIHEPLLRQAFRLERSNSALLERLEFYVDIAPVYNNTFINHGVRDVNGNYLLGVPSGSGSGLSVPMMVIEAGQTLSEIGYIQTYRDDPGDTGYYDFGFLPLIVTASFYSGYIPLVEQYQIINNFNATLHTTNASGGS
jgi:hypothetical protein